MNRLAPYAALLAFCLTTCVPVLAEEFAAPLEEADKILAPFSQEVTDCVKKVTQWLPPVEIQTLELALDKVSIIPGHEASSLRIPLRHARGPMIELHQALKDLDGALQFLRLLQTGKIGSVTAEAYDSLFITDRLARRFSKQDVRTCERSHVLTVIKECTVCTITRWNSVKP